MDLRPEVFLQKIDCKSIHVLYTYLDRAEFAHIIRYRQKDRKVIYKNVQHLDILRLKLLAHRRSMSFKDKALINNAIRKIKKQMKGCVNNA